MNMKGNKITEGRIQAAQESVGVFKYRYIVVLSLA